MSNDADPPNDGSRNHLLIGDWGVATDGNVSLVGRGESVYIGGNGASTSLLMDATNTASIYCGPALLVLAATDNGQVGSLSASAGDAGSIELLAGPTAEGSFVSMDADELTLQIGVVDVGAAVKLTPESITLSVGPAGEGSSITLTAESITLKIGEVTLTLTPAGITEDVAECTRELTAEGHNFAAAETVLNVGVSGQTSASPTDEADVEAGTVENETLGSDTTDAAKNVDAAIQITE